MSFESVRDFKKGKEVSISEVIQFNVPLCLVAIALAAIFIL